MTRKPMVSVFSGKPLGFAMFNQVDGFWITEESGDWNQVQLPTTVNTDPVASKGN